MVCQNYFCGGGACINLDLDLERTGFSSEKQAEYCKVSRRILQRGGGRSDTPMAQMPTEPAGLTRSESHPPDVGFAPSELRRKLRVYKVQGVLVGELATRVDGLSGSAISAAPHPRCRSHESSHLASAGGGGRGGGVASREASRRRAGRRYKRSR